MEVIIGLILGVVISAVISGFIIWLVSKFNIGLSVDNFGWAMLAGLFIGFFTNLIMHFVPGQGGIVTAVVQLLVAAAVIVLAGKVFSGVKVDGYSGALVAAVIMALISFGLAMLLAGAAATAVSG